MKKLCWILFVALLGLGAVQAHDSVNINTADAKTLAAGLNGVGLAKAQAIVAFRRDKGDFKSVDEIVKVTGIGLATLTKNRDRMRVVDDQSSKKVDPAG